MEWGRATEAPPLDEELLVISKWWEGYFVCLFLEIMVTERLSIFERMTPRLCA